MRTRIAAVLAAAALLAAAIVLFGMGHRDAAETLGPEDAPAAQVEARETEAPPLPLYEDPAIRARWTSDGITDYTKQEVRLLPILDYAKNATDKVAITVDDCLQFDNLRAILDLADEYGAKLTFFPIGYRIAKHPEIWKEILDRGHELENHSYHHLNVNGLSDKELFETIAWQERAMSKALGVNYKMKYFRPKGGYSRKEPRLSKVLRDLGYQAIASWGLSGTQSVSQLLEKCKGGHVVLFHTTDKDLEKLRQVIPALKEKGLKMVTLNELYGKPANVITPLAPRPTAATSAPPAATSAPTDAPTDATSEPAAATSAPPVDS
jgi:peptidoglycan/xylan/chitin deacetylase (PgdA/CDA1 family)